MFYQQPRDKTERAITVTVRAKSGLVAALDYLG